jgi:hypothetical protein
VLEFAQENLPGRQVVAIARPALTDFCDPLNELVAKKIIEIAKTGERNPSRLRDRALKSLQS